MKAITPALRPVILALCAAAFAAWIVLELAAAFWFPKGSPAVTHQDVMEMKARAQR